MNNITETLHFEGIITGLYSFITIVIARWACIKGEYYFTKWFWIAFLIIGIVSLIYSLLCTSLVISTLLGITGFTYLWGIHEIIEQEERVNKGWYPKRKLEKK